MKKLKLEPVEIDLYVNPKKMTDEERKELAEFIERVKQNKKRKPKKAA